MADPTFDVADAHRWFAVETNNAVWEWLEANPQGAEPTDPIIHAAHASYHHWSHTGTAIHAARAAVVVANVHAAVGNGALARSMAAKSAALLAQAGDDAADWDHAFTLDVTARAAAASGDPQARELKEAARSAGSAIADPANKASFDAWFGAGNWHHPSVR